MGRRWRRLAVVAALVAAGPFLGGAPAASAAAGVAMTLTGAGVISPGLTPTGTHSNSWTFNGNSSMTGEVGGTAVVARTGACTASGSSIVETYEAGVGTGNWNCTWGFGTLTYVRAGAWVDVTFTGTMSGKLYCLFLPDQTPPATVVSYHLTCAGAAASA